MATTRIHAFSQATMLSPYDRGTCYWQCTYVSTNQSLWGGSAFTYATAVDRAREFRSYQAIINYSRARRVNAPEQEDYSNVDGTLTGRRVYSIALYVGQSWGTGPSPLSNHEAICATNAAGTEVCVFDPNLGFYLIDTTDGGNNRQALETGLGALYGNGVQLGAFQYQVRRTLSG